MKDLEITDYDLTSVKDATFWEELKELTVRGWSARDEFNNCQSEPSLYSLFKIKLARVAGKGVAWAALVRGNGWNQAMAYTHPCFRQKGIQKILLKELSKETEPETFYTERDDEAQIRTFRYFDKENR